jgi:pyruvate kinase
MRPYRKAEVVATLGPARSEDDTTRTSVAAGADAFLFNFNNGADRDHQAGYDIVRKVEQEIRRLIPVLADLHGPRFRFGKSANGPIKLAAGVSFGLDLNNKPGCHSIIAHELHDIADVTASASRVALDEDLRAIWAMPPLAGGETKEHEDV